MPSKGDLCCCGCKGKCVNLGSLIPSCPAICPEFPLEIEIHDYLGAALTSLFKCCDPLRLRYILRNDGSSCTWSTSIIHCPDGKNAQWTLFFNTDGTVVLTLTIDGDSATWVNADPWRCLCPNLMRIFDPGLLVGCGLPHFICLDPIDPCCPLRVHPMPRTLWLQMTNLHDCPCGVGLIAVNWDPSINRWVGDGTFCGFPLHIEVWCIKLLESLTDWFVTITIHGKTMSSTTDFPLLIHDCDPVHLQWKLSYDGECGSITALTQFDVVEV